MTAVAHGRKAKFYVNGYDLSGYFTKVGVTGKADTAEVSVLGTDDKEFLNGMAEGSISGDGYYTDGPGEIASVMGSAFTSDDTDIFSHLPQGDAFGAKAIGLESIVTDVNIDADTGAAGKVTVSGQSNVGFDSGVILHALAKEVAGGNSQSILDETNAPTTNGIDSYVQVVDSSGGNLQVKVQHCADNSTWVDLVTHTIITESHVAERIPAVVGQTVQKYIRCLWTLTGDATFHHSASRK